VSSEQKTVETCFSGARASRPPVGGDAGETPARPGDRAEDGRLNTKALRSKAALSSVFSPQSSGEQKSVETCFSVFRTGGDGKAIRIVQRRAKQLQREKGYTACQLLDYSEGIESATPFSYRVSEGTIRLMSEN
jgi:hypothetical protein